MSTDHDARPLPDRVEVGRVGKPHGVRGEVSVVPESDVEGRFAAGRRLTARCSSGATRLLEIASSRRHGELWLLRFAGCEDRDAAEALRGAVLEIERSQVPPPPEGSYYYYELIDCRCADRTVGELGRVTGILEDGGGLLLELAAASGTLLVPFVEAYLVSVDVAAGRIELDLPPGLVEACTSTS
jgi:16S rRNA processing protein RimM